MARLTTLILYKAYSARLGLLVLMVDVRANLHSHDPKVNSRVNLQWLGSKGIQTSNI